MDWGIYGCAYKGGGTQNLERNSSLTDAEELFVGSYFFPYESGAIQPQVFLSIFASHQAMLKQMWESDGPTDEIVYRTTEDQGTWSVVDGQLLVTFTADERGALSQPRTVLLTAQNGVLTPVSYDRSRFKFLGTSPLR